MKFTSFSLAAAALCLLTLSSCGKFGRLSEDEKTTSVSVGSLSNGQARNGRSAPAMRGGVMIWGISDKQKVAIALGDENQVAEKVLKNGTWKFYAMGYAGTMEMQGAISCGSTTKNLIGADTNVDITITTAGCADSFFGGNAAAPVPLRLVSCNSLATLNDGSATCASVLRGDFYSFKVRLQGSEPAALAEDAPEAGFLSPACVVADPNPYSNTIAPFPVGPAGQSPMKVSVEAYTSADCSGTPKIYRFGNGLRNPLTNGPASPIAIFYPGSNTFTGTNALYLVHGAVPPPAVTGIYPPEGSWGGGTVITINGANFDAGTSAMIGGLPCDTIGTPTAASLMCKTRKPSLLAPAPLPVVVKRGFDLAMAPGPSNFNFIEEGFGDAGTGDTLPNPILTTPFLTSTAGTLAGSRPFHSYANISVVADQKTLTFRTTVGANDFAPGDDVLWHVSAASSDTACSITGKLKPGAYGFSKLDSASTVGVVLRTWLPAVVDLPNLANTSRFSAGTAFCVIQLVRFPSFRYLTIDTGSAPSNGNISPPPFDLASGKGGIIVLQVHDKLFLQGTSDVSLNVEGAGYAGGTVQSFSGTPGDGIFGSLGGLSTAPNSTGGGGASSSNAGGGGASSEAAGGNGGGTPLTGAPRLPSCSPLDPIPCARFGGGGGGGNATGSIGGVGGGIAFVFARNVDNFGASTNKLLLNASGKVAGVSRAGGGAGGVVHLKVAAGRSGIIPAIVAHGGAGAAPGVDKGGGGGAGGQVIAAICPLAGIGSITPDLAGGTAAAGSGVPGTPGGAGLLATSTFAGVSVCL